MNPDGGPKREVDFAYVFERFPSFTQTFCVREILALERQGVKLALFSIHGVESEDVHHFPPELFERVYFLPQEKELVARINQLKDERKLPQSVVLTLREWGDSPDKSRVYEAAYIGLQLRELGVRHVHTHFAGIGARTCWWMRQFYQITYGFTGHANDLFVEPGKVLPLTQVVADASLVVTVSDYTTGWLRREFPRAASKVRRVYNGLDIASIALGTAEAAKAEPPLILSVGRLIEKKGFDDLILSCSKLRDGGARFKCLIAGNGPMEQELQALIHTHQLTDYVTLLGAQSQDQIQKLLGQAFVFALPCVTEQDGGKDNLPTVIMEAMAASLPCVSTILAGVPEMVVHGETGLLCEERQPATFAALLHTYLQDPVLAKTHGAAGRERAGKLFAQEITSRQLLALHIEHGDISHRKCPAFRQPEMAAAFGKQRWHRMKRWWHQLLHPPGKRAIKP